jgi:transcriptional regulator with XRE-family HTH domain
MNANGTSDAGGTGTGGTGTGSTGGGPAGAARRTELAAFLRARRERITPEDVGLLPGARRRTAGLRREELAQLAGVGVTWYTWLEQGRPINASVQVLDAIATTLRLDPVERAHLFRLADLPGAPTAADCPDCPLPPEVQLILDSIKYPASVLTERFDVIAWNQVYAALFPGIVEAAPGERNTLLVNLSAAPCCSAVEDHDKQCVALVGQLRAAYGRHLGDPAWTHFIRRMEAVSPVFAEAWATHEVAQPGRYTKHFRHPTAGRITATSTSFAVTAVAGARLVVYTPDDEASEKAIALLGEPGALTARFSCWNTHDPERVRLTPAT